MCLSIVEHDHSSEAYEKLNLLSDTAKNLCCGRTKCTAIIQNVIWKGKEAKVLERIRNQEFIRLLIDEFTDISADYHLTLAVRTVRDDGELKSNFSIFDKFLTLLSVDAVSAEGIYKRISMITMKPIKLICESLHLIMLPLDVIILWNLV